MNINKKRVAIIGTVAAVAISGTGVAYAYWTAGGTGTGSATAGTTVDWVITSQATTGSPLSPGGAIQTANFTVANPGTVSQRLGSVVVTVADSNGDPWSSGNCSAADFSLAGGTAGQSATLNINSDIAAGGSTARQVTIQMVETGQPQNDCKGVTVPLYYEAS